MIHLVFTLYSMIILPFIVGFEIKIESKSDYFLYVIEILCFLDMVLVIITELRTCLYINGMINANAHIIF